MTDSTFDNASNEAALYGFETFGHGGQRILTVISPAGASAVLARCPEVPGVVRHATAGQPVRFMEIRSGAFDALIEDAGIVALHRSEWQRTRDALGDLALVRSS